MKTKQYSQHHEAIVSRKRKAAFTEEQRQQVSAYQRQYRLAHKQEAVAYRGAHREQIKQVGVAFRCEVKARRKILREYKEQRGCMDCGNMNPLVLDFDHRDQAQKVANVCQMVTSHSMKKVWMEVVKCDVVCRNCHSIRTFTQMRWAV